MRRLFLVDSKTKAIVIFLLGIISILFGVHIEEYIHAEFQKISNYVFSLLGAGLITYALFGFVIHRIKRIKQL